MIKSAFGDPTTNQVSCELVADISFSYVGRHKTCIMERRTKIDDANASLSSAFNEQICGFRMNLNKKISFLPVKVDEKFPNLVGYSAQFCNIKAIKKENFMNLGKLKSIWLNRNQITIVPTDAFDDLESLQYLGICECYLVLQNFHFILTVLSSKLTTRLGRSTERFSKENSFI